MNCSLKAAHSLGKSRDFFLKKICESRMIPIKIWIIKKLIRESRIRSFWFATSPSRRLFVHQKTRSYSRSGKDWSIFEGWGHFTNHMFVHFTSPFALVPDFMLQTTISNNENANVEVLHSSDNKFLLQIWPRSTNLWRLRSCYEPDVCEFHVLLCLGAWSHATNNNYQQWGWKSGVSLFIRQQTLAPERTSIDQCVKVTTRMWFWSFFGSHIKFNALQLSSDKPHCSVRKSSF